MHKILLLLLAVFLMFACKEITDEHKVNKEIVSKVFLELINEKKVGNIEKYYIPNATDHSAWPGQSPGRDGLKKSIEDFHAAYSTLNVKVEEMIAADDKVITRESWTGVSRAENKSKSGTVMHIFQLKNGMITDEWSEGWEWLQ